MEENDRTIWFVVLAVMALVILFGSFGMGGYGMMGFGMGFGMVFMLLFGGALVWLVVTLADASKADRKEEDPMSILKKRYASGEITKKLYEDMKKELK